MTNTNSINIEDRTEVAHILVHSNMFVQDSSTKLLRVVGLSQFKLYAQRGWHFDRGAVAKGRLKGSLARGPLGAIQVLWSGRKTLPRLMLNY